MKQSRFIPWILGVCVLVLGLSSCEDKMDEHYKIPDWLKGSAFEVLEAEGNYTLFLKGVEKAGYKPIVNGKSILTVMAPDDAAFTAYLNQKGYASLDAMSPEALKKLIGFHLVYYAFDWDKLVNFRPLEGDGATAESKARFAGYYYKHRTKSSDPISQAFNPATNDSVSVYHLERFLPVFSYKLFQTKHIDAATNYTFFYPGTTWTGGTTGFNVSNASVTNADNVITSNGYIYYVNQVLDPLETIYTELKNRYNEYSLFFDLYNGYSQYTIDNELTKNFGKGDTLYLHGHNQLPPVAYEWPVSDYQQIGVLSSKAYNVFAPSNTAMTAFFNDFWRNGGYPSLNDLDPLVLKYFIMQSFSSGEQPVFPEEISRGDVTTTYGTPIRLNPDDVTLRKMCVNGTLYGMDRMTPPAIFSSVAGPAFKYMDYRYYLYALAGSDLLLALASDDASFISLMPDTAQFVAENMRMANLTTGNVLQVFSDDAGVYVDLSKGEMADLVNMHVSNGATALSTTGTQVLETNMAFNYWYVNDGKITTNALFNQQLNPDFTGNPFVPFTEIKPTTGNWDNGKSYAYDFNGLFKADKGDGLEYAFAIANDARYHYYLFAQLLQKAGLVNEGQLNFLMDGSRFIAFVPTNDAIKDSLAVIPGTSGLSIAADGRLNGSITTANKAKLANWLRSYFITSDLNTFTVYPYPGAGLSGSFDTYGSNKLKLTDAGQGMPLSVQFIDGKTNTPVNVVSTFHYLPFAFKDGCFHLIERILN